MKFVRFIVFTHLFFFTARTDAVPPSTSILVYNQDLTFGELEIITFDSLYITPKDPDSSFRAVTAIAVDRGGFLPIPSIALVCQAFKDDAGRERFGPPFRRAPSSIQRFSDTPVPVGSIFCSDAAAVRAYTNRRPADGVPVVKASPIPFVNVQLTSGGFDSEGEYDGRGYPFDEDVPVDGSVIVPRDNPPGKPRAAKLSDLFGNVDRDKVSCQLYEDEKGTRRIWKPFSGLNPVYFTRGQSNFPVRGIRCYLIRN